MGIPTSMLLFSIMSLFVHQYLSSTVIVDGVTKWTNPTAYIGDSIIFKHKYEYELYIFQNRGAFKVCDFTRATLLTKPNSTSFTWHPSRPGFFYFSFNNGATKPCQKGQKLAIKVSPSPPQDSATSPYLSPLSPSTSSPSYDPWPFQPKESFMSPSPSQTETFLAAGPTSAPGRGLPFINSNPVVQFPTGEGDSATIRPAPISQGQVVVGFLAAQMAFYLVTFVLLLLH